MEWLVNITTRPLCPRKETRYPLYRTLFASEGLSERAWRREISWSHRDTNLGPSGR